MFKFFTRLLLWPINLRVAAIGAVGAIGSAVISSSSQPSTSGLNNSAANADNEEAQIAQNEWNNFATNFQPLENKFVGEANNWTSPQNYATQAGAAQANVNSQFSNAQQALERTPGIDPSSGAYQAGMANLGLAQAASSATAQNTARSNVQNQGIQMQEAAMNIGVNQPAQAASAAGSSAAGLSNLSNSVNAQNTASANSIGSAISSVANGVTNYANSGTLGGNLPTNTISGYGFTTPGTSMTGTATSNLSPISMGLSSIPGATGTSFLGTD